MIILVFSAILLPFVVLSGENANGISSSGIALEGEFKTGGIRSGGDTVTAEVQGSVIIATFHRNLGNVLVTLTNVTGDMVYETTVNTSVQQQAFIPLSGLSPGIYTITFSNDLGEMWGEFDL